MRVLVCGGRDYDDSPVVARVLELLHTKTPIAVLIHGAATGADTLADGWAHRQGVRVLKFPVSQAEWRTYGKEAGNLRNEYMLGAGRPELVVAFPGRSGTGDMLIRAMRAHLPWVHVDRVGAIRGTGKKFFAKAKAKAKAKEVA